MMMVGEQVQHQEVKPDEEQYPSQDGETHEEQSPTGKGKPMNDKNPNSTKKRAPSTRNPKPKSRKSPDWLPVSPVPTGIFTLA
jgi:hypothetical protein